MKDEQWIKYLENILCREWINLQNQYFVRENGGHDFSGDECLE